MFTNKLNVEIESFKKLWKGGFRTGYNIQRNQKGLEKYLQTNLTNDMVILEIGCGGGQWTKFYEPFVKKIYCIDVLSADHNNFWNYVGEDKKNKITYITVNDFLLKDIPDNSIDYVFSYDVFCHISLSGQDLYLKNLYNKCKDNCVLNIMYADCDKYFKNEPHNIVYQETDYNIFNNHNLLKNVIKNDCDGTARPGRWYWVGIEKFINLCKKYNYTIINEDINIDKTNPITIFRK